MKTTIEISDELLRKAKQVARSRGTTLRALVEQGLRRAIEPPESGAEPGFRLVVFEGRAGFTPEFADGDWARIKDEARRR